MANDGVGVDVKALARGPTRGAGSQDLIQPVSGPIDMINILLLGPDWVCLGLPRFAVYWFQP